jgi:peptidoglycan/xylan/chitin deacetylase (PgdA/CDA1 family)
MTRASLAVMIAFAVVGCGQARHATSTTTPAPTFAQKQPPARRAKPRPHRTSTPIPILMYHVIGTAPAGAPYPGLYVPRAEFASQVSWLAAHGYHAVTLDHVYDAWKVGAPLPSKPVVFTFDDGYVEDLTAALPVLHARSWPGVLFLRVGNLDPPRVHVLRRAHWEIDAHTFNHVDLTTEDAAQLRHDVAGSREWIRRVFHVPCDFFSYPSGRYDTAAVAAVRSAGYRGAVTTTFGFASPKQGMFTLDRVRVSGGDGAAGLASALRAE